MKQKSIRPEQRRIIAARCAAYRTLMHAMLYITTNNRPDSCDLQSAKLLRKLMKEIFV